MNRVKQRRGTGRRAPKHAKRNNTKKAGRHIVKRTAHARDATSKAAASRAKPAPAPKAAQKQPKKQMTAKEKREKLYIPEPKRAREALNTIIGDGFAADYLKKNVSKNALDVLSAITAPKTAEQVSALLDIKINFVRSMLNIMQGYGITNYYVAKNDNGWLSFAWYINTTKLQSFFEYIRSIKGEEVVIKDDCNDYFVCSKCYGDTKLIFAFDAAYEAGFRCKACGGKFKMIDRSEAENLVKVQNSALAQSTPT